MIESGVAGKNQFCSNLKISPKNHRKGIPIIISGNGKEHVFRSIGQAM